MKGDQWNQVKAWANEGRSIESGQGISQWLTILALDSELENGGFWIQSWMLLDSELEDLRFGFRAG